MEEKLNINVFDEERYKEIITKTGPFVESAFKTLKYELGGRLPVDFCMGYVAGYLKANGFTNEESLIASDKFYQAVTSIIGEPEVKDTIFTIRGNGDGSVTTKLEEQ